MRNVWMHLLWEGPEGREGGRTAGWMTATAPGRWSNQHEQHGNNRRWPWARKTPEQTRISARDDSKAHTFKSTLARFGLDVVLKIQNPTTSASAPPCIARTVQSLAVAAELYCRNRNQFHLHSTNRCGNTRATQCCQHCRMVTIYKDFSFLNV